MRFLFFPLLALGSTTASAAPASIWWSAWKVNSSEELSQGVKYPQKWQAPRYSLTRLFDGDSKTAWVYSATSHEFYTDYFKTRYGLRLEPQSLVTLDTIRILNGQNVSLARFKANDRAKSVRIILSNGKTRYVYLHPLANKQGWQTLRFPPFRAKTITLEFPQITRSQSKGADFCLSELELQSGGRKIPWNMPHLVMYYDGLEGDADDPLLIRRDGFPLEGIEMDAGYQDTWSPSGRYVAGMIGEKEGERLWIYDAARGVKISKSSHPSISQKDSEWLKRLPQGT